MSPTLWVEVNAERTGVGTLAMYLDANSIVTLIADLRRALVKMTEGSVES